MSINRVNISGNLTRDAELRTTANGVNILGFTVAVSDRRKDGNGEWSDFPNYISCSMFGARAEKLSSYLLKGTKVAVEGKLRWSQWQDRDTGKNRSRIEVVVDELELMSRREGGYVAPSAEPSIYDADIPF